MNKKSKQQEGSVWLILLILAAVVIGSWQYSEYRSETKKRMAEEISAQQKREADRIALEQRLEEEKAQKDALATTNKTLDAILMKWDDAVKLAGNTSRIALSTTVATLQDIRREAAGLTVSPCMDQAKAQLVESMQSTIDGFIVFMRNELKLGDVMSQDKFKDAASSFAAFKTGRSACSG